MQYIKENYFICQEVVIAVWSSFGSVQVIYYENSKITERCNKITAYIIQVWWEFTVMRLIDCFLFQWVITSYDVDLINTAKCATRNLVVYSTRGKRVLSAINIEVDRIL